MGSGFGRRRRSCRPNGEPVPFMIWGFRLLTLLRRLAQAPSLRPTNANLMESSIVHRNVQNPNSRGLLDLKTEIESMEAIHFSQ